MKPQLVQGLVALTAAIAIAVTGYWWFFGRPSPAPAGCITNPPARLGGPLALTVAKEAGPAERADFKGAPTLVYFGFTRCPDICPTTMYLVEEALSLLGERAQHVQTALVSLDPEHDTPETLAQYVQTDGFPRGLVGLTGGDDAVVRPDRNAPLPLLDDVRDGCLDELAHPAESGPTPVSELVNSF